jgi:hypothetical protein
MGMDKCSGKMEVFIEGIGKEINKMVKDSFSMEIHNI